MTIDDDLLGTFMGRPILKTGVAITNAGDGLSKALAIEPQLLDPDEPVYVVLRCAPGGFKGKPLVLDDEQREGWELIHVLRAGLATIVPAELVTDLLDAQQRKLDEAAGIARLPLGEGMPDSDGVPSDAEAEVARIAQRRKRKAEADLVTIEEVVDGDRSEGAG